MLSCVVVLFIVFCCVLLCVVVVLRCAVFDKLLLFRVALCRVGIPLYCFDMCRVERC